MGDNIVDIGLSACFLWVYLMMKRWSPERIIKFWAGWMASFYVGYAFYHPISQYITLRDPGILVWISQHIEDNQGAISVWAQFFPRNAIAVSSITPFHLWSLYIFRFSLWMGVVWITFTSFMIISKLKQAIWDEEDRMAEGPVAKIFSQVLAMVTSLASVILAASILSMVTCFLPQHFNSFTDGEIVKAAGAIVHECSQYLLGRNF